MGDRFLSLKQSHNRLPAVEIVGGPHSLHKFVREVVQNADMRTDQYRVSKAAGAFLQGADEGWTLVEFWGEGGKAFVDYINENYDAYRMKDVDDEADLLP